MDGVITASVPLFLSWMTILYNVAFFVLQTAYKRCNVQYDKKLNYKF